MKYFLTICFLLAAVAGFSQAGETRYKTAIDSSQVFLIKYQVKEAINLPDVTEPVMYHYHADITVFRLVRNGAKVDTVFIADKLERGVYYEPGSAIDMPLVWVRKAKEKYYAKKD